ncbi:MAG: phage minor head protein [Parvibaculales bacterium]
MDRSSPAYEKAFNLYLRTGTPVARTLKQARTTTHYIWRTRRDSRVRPSHAENDGKVFAWNNPPPTGHPGEDYGCRCIAEPYKPHINEHMEMVMSGISDAARIWKDGPLGDFMNHYLFGNGQTIRLRDTGHLQNIVNEYRRLRETAVLSQIADAARQKAGSSFVYDFYNTYNMKDIVWDLGKVTIGGVAKGSSRLETTGALTLSGRCDFYFYDHYRDIFDYFNILPGDNLDWPLAKPYIIYDKWQGHFSGTVHSNRNLSKYTK